MATKGCSHIIKEQFDDFGVHHMQWWIQTISGKVDLLSLMMVKDFDYLKKNHLDLTHVFHTFIVFAFWWFFTSKKLDNHVVVCEWYWNEWMFVCSWMWSKKTMLNFHWFKKKRYYVIFAAWSYVPTHPIFP